MSAITKAAPKAILTGIRDESRRALVVEPEQIPQHLPLMYLFTERGPEDPQLVAGAAFTRMYGAESLNPTSRFYNHQSALASIFMANANQIMVQRVLPANAAKARLRLSLEIVRTKVQQYARNSDGSFQLNNKGKKIWLDDTGAPIPFDINGNPNITTETPGTVEGYNLIWRRNILTGAGIGTAFGGGNVVTGHRTETGSIGISSYTNVKSVLYPILDLEVSTKGDFGNNIALKLSAPNIDDFDRGDASLMNTIGAYLFRFTCMEKPTTSTTPLIVETLGGDLAIDLAFKENTTHPVTGESLNLQEQFIDQWQDLQTPGTPKTYGPFGRIHTYTENVETILGILTQGETVAAHDTRTSTTVGVVTSDSVGEKSWDATALTYGTRSNKPFAATANRFLFNFLTAIDPNGVPYETVATLGTSVNGINFGPNTLNYCTAGDDALALVTEADAKRKNLLAFDKAVATALDAFGTVTSMPLLSEALYPISALWDSGFSIETKKKFFNPMGLRKDLYVMLTTHSVGEYDAPSLPVDAEFKLVTGQQSVSTERSIALALRTAAFLYPESIIDGTSTCRACVFAHSGKLLNSLWKETSALIMDVGDKVSKYMGASNGSWTNVNNFTLAPRNQVTVFRDINNAWQSESNYLQNWDAGLNNVQYFDRQSYFWPAFKTVYPDDTSVLNSFLTMAACVELEHVVQRSWRELTGNTTLTNAQFIERSNQSILDKTKDRFDGLFVIQPETYYTAADDARGYSWTCKLHIYANNMKTVGTYTVVAHRMSDLAAG